MRFSLSCAIAFTATLFYSSAVNALPVAPRADGLIHLPLKRLHQPRSSPLHPQILLQQHINRSHRRLARMTGTTAPTEEQLRRSIEKRLEAIAAESSSNSRRYHKSKVGKLAGLLHGQHGKNNGGKGTKGGKGGKGGKGSTTSTDATATDTATDTTATDTATDTTATDTATDTTATDTATDTTATDTATDTATATETATDSASETATATTTSAAETASNTGFSDTRLQAANGGLTAGNTPEDPNSLALDIDANDVGYIAHVQIGTPPRDFKLLMDSGSADFWVGGENCVTAGQGTAGGDCGKHTFLGTQSSSTFVDSGTAFQVTYGTGAVAGTIIKDDITLASKQVLTGHIFGVATQETVDFSDDSVPFDGLIGLAQSSLSNQGVPTPVEALAAQGLIADAITSYKISRVDDQLNDGEITFGGLDATKFDAASLVSTPNVNTQGFWESDVDAITVDGVDLGLSGRTAIMDTGTTLMVVPADDAAAIHAAIPGAKNTANGFTVPCTNNAVVALTLGGQSFSINPADIAFLPVDATDLTGDCFSGISAGQIGGANEWLVGDVFLKNVYLSTDVTKNTLSYATLV